MVAHTMLQDTVPHCVELLAGFILCMSGDTYMCVFIHNDDRIERVCVSPTVASRTSIKLGSLEHQPAGTSTSRDIYCGNVVMYTMGLAVAW